MSHEQAHVETAEVVEGRELAKGKAVEQNRVRTQRRGTLQRALDRIRQAAQRDRATPLTALWHHVYGIDRLREAYHGLNRDAAPGIDGQTWAAYGEDLEANLRDLSDRLQRGADHALPVARVYILKPDGRQRPIGKPTREDKIVQRATVEVLNAIYEGEFLGFSYGFRPGRCPHDALDAVTVGIEKRNVNWVLDADIRGFFDAIDHEWLVKFIEHRMGDQRVVRHMQKGLKAGVLEDGQWRAQEEGTPQGGKVSPLAANISLHYVLDVWAERWRRRYARGAVSIVRYGDDVIVGFEHRDDAERFWAELRERFRKFNLGLHPEKTRLLAFGRFAADRRQRGGQGKPETFDFLGFTHSCRKTRTGKFRCGVRPSPSGCARNSRRSSRPCESAGTGPSGSSGHGAGVWSRATIGTMGCPATWACYGGFGTAYSAPGVIPCDGAASGIASAGSGCTTSRRSGFQTPHLASVPRATPARHDPRQEPGAVVPHAGICAGGAG
jgi:RNA-directed DNA polymerase